jgi:hypothetical protein
MLRGFSALPGGASGHIVSNLESSELLESRARCASRAALRQETPKRWAMCEHGPTRVASASEKILLESLDQLLGNADGERWLWRNSVCLTQYSEKPV